jgi:hypothetical protein
VKIQTLFLAFLIVSRISIIPTFADNIRIGVVQMQIETSIDENLDKILSFIAEAKKDDCGMVGLILAGN